MWILDNAGTRVHVANTQQHFEPSEPFRPSFASSQLRQSSNERIDLLKQKLETGQKGIDSHAPDSPEWKSAANDYFSSVDALREEQKALKNEQVQYETLKRNTPVDDRETHRTLSEQSQWLQTQNQKVSELLQQVDGDATHPAKDLNFSLVSNKVPYQRDHSIAAPVVQQYSAPTIDLGKVQSPRDAVLALHDLPIPDSKDLAGMSTYPAMKTYEARAASFNAARHDAAQAALDKFRPDLGDYASLNGATARMEYAESTSWYNKDPYIAELQRIVAETTAHPTDIPAYLKTNNEVQPDVRSLSTEQMRTTLSRLGVDLPANASASQLQAGYDILATLPEDIFAQTVNPGMSVGYNQTVFSPGSLNLSRASVNTDVQVEGKVELSDVYTGVDFRQTQQFEMSVQVQGSVELEISNSKLHDLYKWAGRLKMLPDSARQLVESSPILSRAVKGLPVTGSYTEFAGARLKYEATVTPQQGQQLDDGHLSAAPNPFDPLAMQQGTSVLIRGQSLTGSEFEASYKAFNISGKTTELDGLGFGVTKLEGSKVQVYSGPVETVEAESFLGIGRGGLARVGIEASTTLERQDMSTAVIDLSTSEGQAAYQKFISTGRVPDWNPPGVANAGKADVFAGDHAARLALEAGPVSVGFGNKSLLNITRTTWQDGSIEQQNTYAAGPNHLTNVQFTMDPYGKVIEDKTKWQVVMGNYHPVLASYMNGAYSADANANVKFDGEQHVQLTFTTAELMKLHELARESVASIPGGTERLARMDQDQETQWSLTDRLAVAKTPEDIFFVVSNDFNSSSLAEQLIAIRIQTGKALPGQMQMKDAG